MSPKQSHISPRRTKQLCYIAADFVSSVLVWFGFLLFRWLVYEGRLFSVEDVLIPAFNFYRPLLIYPVFCLVVYYLSGYYMQPQRRRVGSELLTTFLSALFISLVAFFVIIIDDKIESYQRYYLSLLNLFILQFSISYLFRLGVGLFSRAYHYKPRTHTLDEAACRQLLAADEVILPAGTERVIVEVPNGADEQGLFSLIQRLYPLRVEIAFTARTYDLLTGRAKVSDLKGQPLVCVTDMPMSDFQLAIKRAFDILTSALSLIILSPLMAAVALAVRCSGKGNIIYKQERIGHYGRPFQILKFRTMREDAETETPLLTADDDPRVTKVGRFLRRYRLDELPQFWNVLRGDMSIVGPRPERAFFINKIVERAPYYCLIYKMRPGLTSWGPIKVGYTDTIEKMVDRLNYDIAYMESMSLLLDLKILFYTLGVIIHGEGK